MYYKFVHKIHCICTHPHKVNKTETLVNKYRAVIVNCVIRVDLVRVGVAIDRSGSE
jgi:hypothetical protein